MITQNVRIVDRATRAALTDLSTYCWFLYAIGPVTLLLRSEQGWSRSIAGAHATAMALGFVIAGLLTRRLPDSFSVPLARRLCLVSVAVACVGLASARSPVVSLTSAALSGTAGALLVNLMNPQLVRHHGSQSAAALALVNAAGATAGACAPLMVGFAASSTLGWRGLLWVLAIFIIALASRRFTALGDSSQTSTVAYPAIPEQPKSSRSTLRFWMAAVALLGGQIVEFTTSLFAADVIHSKVGVSVADSARLGAGFLVGFAAGRWLAAYLSHRYQAA
ncbi:MAG: MFS transporter, partial [Actinobacteria bacterium]|nr:MFS transporter [Actinomycetota bacterium]